MQVTQDATNFYVTTSTGSSTVNGHVVMYNFASQLAYSGPYRTGSWTETITKPAAKELYYFFLFNENGYTINNEQGSLDSSIVTPPTIPSWVAYAGVGATLVAAYYVLTRHPETVKHGYASAKAGYRKAKATTKRGYSATKSEYSRAKSAYEKLRSK